MSDPFQGEVRMFGFDFPPRNWAYCDGQVLAISQNQALFALLGTLFGGNGQTTFCLPDLRGRAAGAAGVAVQRGQKGGEDVHVLTAAEMPVPHTHLAYATTADAKSNVASGKVLAHTSGNIYAAQTPSQAISSDTIATTGGKGHDNMSPYQAVNFCIALQGEFPSRG